MKKVLLACLILSFSQTAYAAWTSKVTVTKLQLGSTGSLWITTSGTRINPAGCSAVTYHIDADFPPFDRYHAMLLSAKASGNEVKLYVNDNTCVNDYPKIQGLSLE